MPFWKKDSDEEAAAKRMSERALKQRAADQEESLNQLKYGGLPVEATRRLSRQASQGGFFSSNLTTSEHLLACEAGYKPLGQVIGSAFMQIGGYYIGGNAGGAGEVTTATFINQSARFLAVERLLQECKLLGADGVIGVRVKKTRYSWGEQTAEFTAIGTAIKVRDRHLLEGIKRLPFTSSLTGQEFWQLFESGYLPCGLVMGNCAYFCGGDAQIRNATSNLSGAWQNQELIQFNDGFQRARSLAMERLQREIALEEGDGAVDMTVEYTIERPREPEGNPSPFGMFIDFVAYGTAIKNQAPTRVARLKHDPLFVIDLKGKSKENLRYLSE